MIENEKVKRSKGFRIQGMDYQERIDNVVLVVGIYDNDSCVPVAN